MVLPLIFASCYPPSSAFDAVGHSIQFPDQKEPFAVPHNGKEVDAQPRVQVTNLAMAGAVVNGAVADGMNALRVTFMQQAAADARDHSFIKGSIVVLVGWEIIKSVSATDALIVVTNVRIETKTSDVIGNPVSVRCPLPVGQPALDKMKKQNTIRKQEQNLLGRIACGEDTRLLKEKILKHTEQHGRLGRAGLAAALQAGVAARAAARGAGSAAAAAPVATAAGLMDPTDAYVQGCMTCDSDSPWFEWRCAARQSCIDVSAWQALDIQTRFSINVYFHRGRKHSLRQGLILAASLSLYFHSSLLHTADTIGCSIDAHDRHPF